MAPDKSENRKGRQKQPRCYQQPSPNAASKTCQRNRGHAQHNSSAKDPAIPWTKAVTAVGMIDKWKGYSPIDHRRDAAERGRGEAQAEEDDPPFAQAIVSLTHTATPQPAARTRRPTRDTTSPTARFRSKPRRQLRHRAGAEQTAVCRWSRPRPRDG